MKKAVAGASVLVVVLTLAQGCATMRVKADYDPKTSFGSYRTFQMSGGTPAPNALAQARLDEALISTLQSKGLQPAESNPDLKVYSHVQLSVEKHIDYDSFGYAGYGYRGYGWAVAGPTSATVREYPVGTLIVDLVDVGQKKLVWRGTATDYINQNLTPEQSTAKAREVMTKLFATFPPTPTK